MKIFTLPFAILLATAFSIGATAAADTMPEGFENNLQTRACTRIRTWERGCSFTWSGRCHTSCVASEPVNCCNGVASAIVSHGRCGAGQKVCQCRCK